MTGKMGGQRIADGSRDVEISGSRQDPAYIVVERAMREFTKADVKLPYFMPPAFAGSFKYGSESLWLSISGSDLRLSGTSAA